MKQKPGHSSKKGSNPVPMKKLAPLTYNGTPNKAPLRMSDYGTSPVKKKLDSKSSPLKMGWAPSGMAQQAAAGQAQNKGSRLGAGTGTTGSNLFAPVGQTVAGGGGAPAGGGGGGAFGAAAPAAPAGGAGSGGASKFIDEAMLEAGGVADAALKGAGVDTSDVQGTGKVGDMSDNRVTDYVAGDKKGNRKKKRAARKGARKEFKTYKKDLKAKKKAGKKALKEAKRDGTLSGKEYRQAKKGLRKDTRSARKAARKGKRLNRKENRRAARKSRRGRK